MSADLRIITSGALAKAVEILVPSFISRTGNKVEIIFGSSLGAAHDSIPTRLRKGEQFDLLLLAEAAQRQYSAEGLIDDTWVPLVESHIGVAVREGAEIPDISTVDAFRRTLLAARSVAHAASASGIYLTSEVFPALGIDEEMRSVAQTIFSERVGRVIARGDAEIGFQQMSELLPIPGIRIVGGLPAELQRPFIFGAGFGHSRSNREAAKAFLDFMSDGQSADIIRDTGLYPFRHL